MKAGQTVGHAVAELGLKLEKGKGPVEVLVIDHMGNNVIVSGRRKSHLDAVTKANPGKGGGRTAKKSFFRAENSRLRKE